MTKNSNRVYDPKGYWIAESTDYLLPGQTADSIPAHRTHCQVLEILLHDIRNDIQSVLEIGCGYGRITKRLLDSKIFPNLKRYDAIDISPPKVKAAHKYTQAEQHPELTIWEDYFAGSVNNTLSEELQQRGKGGYDLVIAIQVLMHQLPSDIDHWIKNMGELSNKYILNLDWFEPVEPPEVAFWNFIHNYEKIYIRQLHLSPDQIRTVKVGDLRQNAYLVTNIKTKTKTQKQQKLT